jgi:hypothetical protein
MAHVKLPPRKAAPAPALPKGSPPASLLDSAPKLERDAKGKVLAPKAREIPANARTTESLGSDHVYTVKVGLDESTLSAWMFFTHKKKFTQAEFDAMVAEAVQITNEVRPLQRRQSFVDTAKPIPQPVQKYNEDMFEADCELHGVRLRRQVGLQEADLHWRQHDARLHHPRTGRQDLATNSPSYRP